MTIIETEPTTPFGQWLISTAGREAQQYGERGGIIAAMAHAWAAGWAAAVEERDTAYEPLAKLNGDDCPAFRGQQETPPIVLKDLEPTRHPFYVEPPTPVSCEGN